MPSNHPPDSFWSNVKLPCPSTGDQVSVGNPEGFLDMAFRCPKCGERHRVKAMAASTAANCCSFCAKPRSVDLRMIDGPHRVAICEECVDLANQTLAEQVDPPSE